MLFMIVQKEHVDSENMHIICTGIGKNIDEAKNILDEIINIFNNSAEIIHHDNFVMIPVFDKYFTNRNIIVPLIMRSDWSHFEAISVNIIENNITFKYKSEVEKEEKFTFISPKPSELN